MLIKSNTTFKINDYYESKDGNLTILTNIKPDFDILRQSKTLEIVPNIKTAKVITIAPKEAEFLYVRTRAVSAGNVIPNKDGSAEWVPIEDYYKEFEKYSKICRNANDNGDFFSLEELKKKYKTFVGKSVFVDHNNENVENARGIIVDAAWNDRGKFVELLKAVDKKAYPELARGVELGYITDTSMGCRCGYSICSICGNEASTEDNFCDHILYYKGSSFNGLPVFEDNRDIEFFEDSFVTQGADPEAKILEKVANRAGTIGVQKHSHVEKHNYGSIINERNQRSRSGRIETFSDQLKNIPWS
jgi:hypothetical protein